jgi:hypothetical protein
VLAAAPCPAAAQAFGSRFAAAQRGAGLLARCAAPLFAALTRRATVWGHIILGAGPVRLIVAAAVDGAVLRKVITYSHILILIDVRAGACVWRQRY